MKCPKPTKLLVSTTVATVLGLSGSVAFAQSAATIESTDSGGGTVTYDNTSGAYPVVTAVLTTPGTLDGYTYKNYSFLAQDSTGSLDMFYASSAYSSYTPTVGDALSVSGTYDPYDGLPEVDPVTAITVQSQGNANPGPLLTTIPQVNVTALNGENLVGSDAGYYVQIDNVTLGNAGSTWTSHANVTTSITDQSGNSMVLYDWASSYSACGALGGTVAPTGLVDVTGFVDFYSGDSEAEFIPVSITAVPEPATMSIYSAGLALAAFGCSRLRKKA